MALELNLDSIQSMKKADFVAAFKNKAIWKKAKAVLILVDYKLDGKKTTVALPYKKEAELKQDFKRLKKEKLHLIKKTGAGDFKIEKATDGTLEAIVNIKLGGLNGELLEQKSADIFSKIKLKIKAAGKAVPQEDTVAESSPENLNKEAEASSEKVEDASNIKLLMKDIATSFKDQIKAKIIPLIKEKKAQAEDQQLVEQAIEKLEQLKVLYNNASDQLKNTLKANFEKLTALEPNLMKVMNALKKLLGTATEEQDQEPLKGKLKRKNAVQDLKSMLANVNEMLANLTQTK